MPACPGSETVAGISPIGDTDQDSHHVAAPGPPPGAFSSGGRKTGPSCDEPA